MYVQLTVDRAKNKESVNRARRASRRAATASAHRMALFVEGHAVTLVPVNEGYLRQSIYSSDADYDALTDTATAQVGATAAYAVYVENGFQGHFVPFHISDSLYYEAIRRWGWRIPTPDQVKHPKPPRRYLVPPRGGSPVWGVFVKGKAQPFLQPATDRLFASGVYITILTEEYEKEFRKLDL
jgi:hypothetical protein